jgi:hypothetical protein
MGGEQVDASFADDNGKLGSGKNSRRFTQMIGLLGLSAYGVERPVVSAPDGRQYPVADGAADAYLQALTGGPARHHRSQLRSTPAAEHRRSDG